MKWLRRQRIVAQPGVKVVVVPLAIDAEVLARQPLVAKPAFLEEPRGSCVARNASGIEPMQAERAERERRNRLDGGAHIAAPGIRLAHPVTDAAGLGDTAADIGNRQPANQRIVLLAEHEE